MKRVIAPTVLLTLLVAAAVLASAPPIVFLTDSFEGYAVGTRLRACTGPGTLPTPGWETPPLSIEPGGDGGGGTGQLIGDAGYACDGSKYVNQTSVTGNGSNSRAWTLADMTSLTTGVLTKIHFQWRRGTSFSPDYPEHAGVWLITSSSTCIAGWVGTAQHVYATTGFTSAGGTEYVNLSGCNDFDIEYDPDGSVKWYANGDLVREATIDTGLAAWKVYVRDKYVGDGDELFLDDLVVGTTARPVVNAPIGGTFVGTNTPTVEWTNASSGMDAYQVRVCTVDNAEGTGGSIAYDSGEIAGSATSKVTDALPTDTHLWAFVNEKYGSAWTGYSVPGNGGFYCTTSAPTTPTVTAPSGTVVGCKPAITFSGGVLHNQFEVKVTTDPAGSTVVWTSNLVDSLLNGASCEAMLSPGTQYYAFAQATNPAGSSAWSAASAFEVTRTGEGTDTRNMDETWPVEQTVYDHENAAPDDGFAQEWGSGMNWISIKWQVLPDPFNRYQDANLTYPNYQPCDWWPSDYGGLRRDDPGYWIIPPEPGRTAPSYVYDLWDTGYDISSNSMKVHKVSGVSLDKGITLMTYASGHCWEGENCGWHCARYALEQAQIYIMDDYGTGKCMASFRYGQAEAGICTDATNWTTASYTDDQHGDPTRLGQGWHLVRITGRNRVIGDPTTCEWNYYLDEGSTPLLTGTGVIDQALVPFAGITDAIAIGNGDACLVGNWQYDWTAVNTDGDYAPGEWSYGETYATASAAVAAGRGKMVTITGETVITAIKLVTGTQVGFWVQDVDTTDYSNIYIPSTETTDVERGHKVTGVSGLLQWSDATGASLASPGFTVTTTDASWPPVTMQSKVLVAGGYPTEYPDGTLTVGRFAQITGEITDLLYLLDGSYAVYLDDGCGLVDGRSADGGNALAKGVRVIVPEPWSFFGAIGDYYEARGICASETAEDRTVRTLLGPSFTEVAAP